MAEYFAKIESVGEGDLVAFRDAVMTHCWAQSQGQQMVLEAPPEAGDLARWLGLEFRAGAVSSPGIAMLDTTRDIPGLEVRRLATTGRFPSQSLEHFRQEGFLGETLFAALVRSSYGPSSEGYFPTRSEVKVTYKQYPLREGEALWDEPYLRDCQLFFMEELTPNQMLRAVLSMSSPAQRARWESTISMWKDELRSALFLAGEMGQSVKPLAGLLEVLLERDKEVPHLGRLTQLQDWDRDAVRDSLDATKWEQLGGSLFPGYEEHREELVYTLGPGFLSWRQGLVKA